MSKSIETTILWTGGKDKAFSGQKNEFVAVFGGLFRDLFGVLPGFRVPKRERGCPFGYVAIFGEKEVLRLAHPDPDRPFSRRPDKSLESEFLLSVDISDMSEEIRDMFLDALFRFLTYGRGHIGRTSRIFQERLLVNGTFIRLPDVMQESVEPQCTEFMKAILKE
ncbi:MAG: hypothetical protein HGB37_00815 [Candidatus Moranbacteria bacterium]|nr:hypothetical protein [Candidatus Moranbacteria bacterium]